MEHFKDIYEKDYKLLLWKDTFGEDIIRHAPKNSYAWRVYEKLFINGNPWQEGLYPTSGLAAIDSLLNQESVILHVDESAYDIDVFKKCIITKLDQVKLPVSPMSIPLTKGK